MDRPAHRQLIVRSRTPPRGGHRTLPRRQVVALLRRDEIEQQRLAQSAALSRDAADLPGPGGQAVPVALALDDERVALGAGLDPGGVVGLGVDQPHGRLSPRHAEGIGRRPTAEEDLPVGKVGDDLAQPTLWSLGRAKGRRLEEGRSRVDKPEAVTHLVGIHLDALHRQPVVPRLHPVTAARPVERTMEEGEQQPQHRESLSRQVLSEAGELVGAAEGVEDPDGLDRALGGHHVQPGFVEEIESRVAHHCTSSPCSGS